MSRWPIERLWSVERIVDPSGADADALVTRGTRTDGHTPGGKIERWEASTANLAAFPAVVMLGAAGLGKTFEMKRLAEIERLCGVECRFERLAGFAWDEGDLESKLSRLFRPGATPMAIYLDGMDEMMVLAPRAGAVIARCLRHVGGNMPSLRISCRSAVWPEVVSEAMRGRYGDKDVVRAQLQPLDLGRDVPQIVQTRGIEPEQFIAAVRAARATSLTGQPLTLDLLMRQYNSHASFPGGRKELFKAACDDLARERPEREDLRTADAVDLEEVFRAAERVACAMELSGKDRIASASTPDEHALTRADFERLVPKFEVREALKRRLLMEADGTGLMAFPHRQIAEFLAGRHIAGLRFDQARNLLAGGGGWRLGVAGPLRETAAWAAMYETEIAGWLVRHDPEVIGLSDGANDELRRAAALEVIDQCRRGERNPPEEQLPGSWLQGLRYDGAALELATVLRSRDEPANVRLCIIDLFDAWREHGAGEALAEVALDAEAPMRIRTRAASAIARLDHQKTRRRLRSLADGVPGDEQNNLRGIALRCLWPSDLATPELLQAISTPDTRGYVGSYSLFLHKLADSGFAADGHRAEGLKWIVNGMRSGALSHTHGRICRNIIQAAVGETADPPILEGLAHLLAEMYKLRYINVVDDLFSISGRAGHPLAEALREQPAARRAILEAVLELRPACEDFAPMLFDVGGALSSDDLEWALDRACDQIRPAEERRLYAVIGTHPAVTGSRMSSEVLERLIPYLSEEIIAKEIWWLQPTELGSESENHQRKRFRREQQVQDQRAEHKPRTPAEIIERSLDRCERADPWWFEDLTSDLFRISDHEHATISFHLINSPQWQCADEPTRARIVAAAKSLLTSERRPAGECPAAHRAGAPCALWLLRATEPNWCDALTPDWWRAWAPLLLPHAIADEDDEVLRTHRRWTRDHLHTHAKREVRETYVAWALGKPNATWSAGGDPLRELESWHDPTLDDALLGLLSDDQLRPDVVASMVRYLAPRRCQELIVLLRPWFEAEVTPDRSARVISAGVALVNSIPGESWEFVLDFTRRSPALGKTLLTELADSVEVRSVRRPKPHPLHEVSSRRLGELLELFLVHFPTRDDPDYTRGVHLGSADDSARWFRTGLTNVLSARTDLGATQAMTRLASRFRNDEPWLDRVRIDVQRAHTLNHWQPASPDQIAQLLDDADRRVFRGLGSVLDFVQERIESFGLRLRRGQTPAAPRLLEALWNKSRRGYAPKEENHLRDMIDDHIRGSLMEHQLVLARESEILRRIVSARDGGRPGEELDMFIEVPSAVMADGERLVVPVEVKRAHNSEVRTALRDQLLSRYMETLQVRGGVYVVGWFGEWADARGSRKRSLWSSCEEARLELNQQAQDLARDRPGIDIRVVVIDASLQ